MISSRDIECEKWARFFCLSMKNYIFFAFNISRWDHPFWLKISGRLTDCKTCLWAKFQIKIPSFDFSANNLVRGRKSSKIAITPEGLHMGTNPFRILLVSPSPIYEQKMSSIGDSHLGTVPHQFHLFSLFIHWKIVSMVCIRHFSN
jgi:hypothetical protein